MIVIAYIPGYDSQAGGYGYLSACYSLTGTPMTGDFWRQEAGMLEKRGGIASSIWPGHGLLVTGGWNGNYLSSTEYLSASGQWWTRQWTHGPILPVAMSSHCQVTAASDVIVTGNIIMSISMCTGLIL